MAFEGSYIYAQATARVKTTNAGTAFPESGYIRTPSLTVTAANGNAGTVYVMSNATTPAGRAAPSREQSMVALKGGESFSFTGVPVGNGYRDFVFGAGYSYILGSATSQRVILTYMKQA